MTRPLEVPLREIIEYVRTRVADGKDVILDGDWALALAAAAERSEQIGAAAENALAYADDVASFVVPKDTARKVPMYECECCGVEAASLRRLQHHKGCIYAGYIEARANFRAIFQPLPEPPQ